ncbi:hypothetical protein SAMN05216276_10054 [Streptosporangium subroseum]|uniref:DUF732 domain-containing protein n=1 Tax=Streptosporangium subroseum TaxID=106412 RepID=A0A239C4A1_9ACTN|nr:hypothetical protein [Streptosporangium subroseum]SNS15095.1 hypothetical protein SAMN05216276_10054 [Streptosporangium subroseum]
MRAALALGVALVVMFMVGRYLGGRPTVKPISTVELPVVSEVIPTSTIPEPDADQAEDLLYGLGQIDRELGRTRSIDRARNTCLDILAEEKRAAVVERTRQRFDGTARISTADARAIVKLIEAGGWCRNA